MQTSMVKGLLVGALLSIGFGLGGTQQASAAPLEGANSTIKKLTFGGDFRLRQESFLNPGRDDRHRQRYRLRFGVKAEIDKWGAALRLASGSGEQTSTNQTFGNGWSQKSLYIDQAFGTYKPLEWLKLTGGRMENPFWRLYSSDLVWDTDVNPEGFAQQIELPLGSNMSLFGTFAQLPVNEISGSKRDPWLFGNQVGLQSMLGGGVRWNVAVANYAVSHEAVSPLLSTSTVDSPVIQGDNTRVSGAGAQLAGQYNMLHVSSELGVQVGLPVRLQADVVRNIHEDKPNGADTGYQFGLIAGAAKTAGSWEAGIFRKYLEANATLSDFSDSDWGTGGTNRKGYVMWLAYCPTDFLTLQTKYFVTKKLDRFAATQQTAAGAVTARSGIGDINRLQIDAVLKF